MFLFTCFFAFPFLTISQKIHGSFPVFQKVLQYYVDIRLPFTDSQKDMGSRAQYSKKSFTF